LLSALIWVVIAIPYLFPQETVEDPYPWFSLGANSIKQLLWDPQMQMFRESPKEWQSYWIDDNAKLLNMFLEDPVTYQSNISNIIENLHKVYYNGYFPRRYVKTDPKIVNSNVKNVRIENGFLRVSGNLSDPYDIKHPLTLTYYEASGKVDFAYLTGNLFTVYPIKSGYYYNWITYDPVRQRADQCQNPGFDVNTSRGEDLSTDLMPWEFSTPKFWNFPSAYHPPFHCVYTTKYAFIDPDRHKRVVGLEVNAEGSEIDWRSDPFNVQANYTYILSFDCRGTFGSGTPFKVFLRWFDSSHNWISEGVIALNTTTNGWVHISQSFTSPSNAVYGDIRIVAYPDTVGSYYFDNFMLNGELIPNGNFETPNTFNVRTDVWRTQYRSGWIYGINDYLRQPLYVPVTVNQFINLTYWVRVGAPANYYVYVWYSDGSYSSITKSCSSTDNFVKDAVQSSMLNPGKTIVAIGFVQGTANVDVFFDDVAIYYKPSGATFKTWVDEEVSPYNTTRLYVEACQNYEDGDVNLTIRFRFSLGNAYLSQIMEFQNKHADYKAGVIFHNALDELSTITTGTGNMKTAYSSIWIPEVGRRYPNPNLTMTTLADISDLGRWSVKHEYFIVELKEIPEWSGCLGLAVKVPTYAFHDIINTKNDNTTLWGDRTGKFLHYLTYSFEFEVPANYSAFMEAKIICLNGYDFVHPEIYDHYFMNLGNFTNLDLSLNYHLGMICYALAKHLDVLGIDPYGMAKGIWQYYREIFNGHNNGSYLMTTGKMIEASMILYWKLDQIEYLGFAKQLADYLVNIQLSDGRFPMKHNNVTYLDCQGACLCGLKLMQGYDPKYRDAYLKGLTAIHYDYQPSGYRRIPVGYVGDNVPHEKRLFVYSNATHIDDDFWTYKASYVARASLGTNQTLTMLGLSRVWSRTTWNNTHLFIWNSESTPENPLAIVDPETNSETQPWGLVAWLEVAKTQRQQFNYYYVFLTKHKAIIYADLTPCHTNVTIYGSPGIGTVSTFYLKGIEEYVTPQVVKVDGRGISSVSSYAYIPTATTNVYYYNASRYILIVKAFPQTDCVNVYIEWRSQPFELWMPILPIMGTVGFILMIVSPIYLISKFKEGEIAEAIAWGFVMFIIGFGLILGWLWSI